MPNPGYIPGPGHKLVAVLMVGAFLLSLSLVANIPQAAASSSSGDSSSSSSGNISQAQLSSISAAIAALAARVSAISGVVAAFSSSTNSPSQASAISGVVAAFSSSSSSSSGSSSSSSGSSYSAGGGGGGGGGGAGSSSSSSGSSYTIQYGDTLSEIAVDHGTTTSALMDANPQISNPDVIYAGGTLTIPSSSGSSSSGSSYSNGGSSSSSSSSSSSGSSYTIQWGDTLSGVAASHGTTTSALMDANPQITNPDVIYAGDALTIPASSAGGSSGSSSSGSSSSGCSYTIQSGDTLSEIAAKHGTTTSDLMDANPQITNPDVIYAGDALTIPASSAGSSQAPARPAPEVSSLNQTSVRAGDFTLSIDGSDFESGASILVYRKSDGTLVDRLEVSEVDGDQITYHGDIDAVGDYEVAVWNPDGQESNRVEFNVSKFVSDDPVQTTANLNTRTGPSIGYSVIRTMPNGSTGEIIDGPVNANGYTWWKISYDDGTTGWSAEPWLEGSVASSDSSSDASDYGEYVVESGDTLSEIAADHGTTVSALMEANPQITNPDVIYAGDTLTIPSSASGSSSISDQSQESSTQQTGSQGKFNTGNTVQTTANLNVRAGSGIGYSVIRTMPNGSAGEVIAGPVNANGYTWWKISYDDGTTGWSAEPWLEMSTASPDSSSDAESSDSEPEPQVDQESSSSDYVEYVVQSGDTLSGIAARYGTTITAIMDANSQITDPDLIYVGQVLRIPQSTPAPSDYVEYVVQSGDTLSEIAARYGTTVSALMNANPQITDPDLIYVGQVLRIPQSTPDDTPTDDTPTDDDKPDLTVTSVSAPSSAGVGDTISVSFTPKNQGDAPSGSFRCRISLSTSAWGITHSMGYFDADSLTAGASRAETESVTVPSVGEGYYYVTVYVDSNETIDESNEQNNIGSTYPYKIHIETEPDEPDNVQTDIPEITWVDPSAVWSGAGRFTLFVVGRNFESGISASVYHASDGSFVDQLTMERTSYSAGGYPVYRCQGSDLALGDYVVKVKNPDGQLSNGVELSVTSTARRMFSSPSDLLDYANDTMVYTDRWMRFVTHSAEDNVIEFTQNAFAASPSSARNAATELAYYVHDYMTYKLENSETPEQEANWLSVYDILQHRHGDCTDYSNLYVSMNQAAGVPARKVSLWFHRIDKDGNPDGVDGHATAEVNWTGASADWIHVDPTWDTFDDPSIYPNSSYPWVSVSAYAYDPDESTIKRTDYYNQYFEEAHSYLPQESTDLTADDLGAIPMGEQDDSSTVDITCTLLGDDRLEATYAITYTDSNLIRSINQWVDSGDFDEDTFVRFMTDKAVAILGASGMMVRSREFVREQDGGILTLGARATLLGDVSNLSFEVQAIPNASPISVRVEAPAEGVTSINASSRASSVLEGSDSAVYEWTNITTPEPHRFELNYWWNEEEYYRFKSSRSRGSWEVEYTYSLENSFSVEWPSDDDQPVGLPGQADRSEVVERVIDGDTIVLRGGERVRLTGVDTPELNSDDQDERQRAQEAKQFVEELLPSGETVWLKVDPAREQDRYGRTRAIVYVQDGSTWINLNEELVNRGLAESLYIEPTDFEEYDPDAVAPTDVANYIIDRLDEEGIIPSSRDWERLDDYLPNGEVEWEDGGLYWSADASAGYNLAETFHSRSIGWSQSSHTYGIHDSGEASIGPRVRGEVNLDVAISDWIESIIGSDSTSSPTESPAGSDETTTYTIQRGDTLSEIAARYNTTVSALMAANPQVTDPDLIYTGDALTIPTVTQVDGALSVGDYAQTTSSAELRRGPGLGYDVVANVARGVIGEIIMGPNLAQGYSWWKVQFDEEVAGWIPGSQLVKRDPPSSSQEMEWNDVNASVELEGEVGAGLKGSYDVEARAGLSGASFNVSGEALAGAWAEGKVSGTVALSDMIAYQYRLSGRGEAGAGANANVGAGVTWDNGIVISYDVGAGASLGVGGSLSHGGRIYINPDAIVERTGLGDAVDQAQSAVEGVAGEDSGTQPMDQVTDDSNWWNDRQPLEFGERSSSGVLGEEYEGPSGEGSWSGGDWERNTSHDGLANFVVDRFADAGYVPTASATQRGTLGPTASGSVSTGTEGEDWHAGVSAGGEFTLAEAMHSRSISWNRSTHTYGIHDRGEASLGPRVQGGVSADAGAGPVDVNVTAQGDAGAGLKGEYDVGADVGLGGASVEAGVSGVAGAYAEGEVSGTVSLADAVGYQYTIGGRAYAGLAGDAGASAGLSWDDGIEFTYSFKLGGALGTGGSVSHGGRLYLNPTQVVEGARETWDAAVEGVEAASDWAYDTYTDARNWVSSLWE